MSEMSGRHPFPAQPLRVIHTKGTDYQMGVQHAEQLGTIIEKGMPRFYHDFWKRMTSRNSDRFFSEMVRRAGVGAMDRLLLPRLIKHLPGFVQDRLRGLADASGQDLKQLLTSAVLPDLMPMLEVLLYWVSPKTFIEVTPPPRFGCTSFVAAGKNFLHGRNLDFPGVAYWDRYPVIQLFEPTNGMKYLGFVTAGVPLPGITGINEAQISVSLHQHYCGEASFKGQPAFGVGEEILAKARSVQEACDILSRAKVASSWAFILTDGKTREAAIVECNPKAVGVRSLEEGPPLTHSNFYQTASCQVSEFATTARMNWDNYYRNQRLQDLLASVGGDPTVAQGVSFISDHFDSYWNEEKIFNRTVSQVYNIQSLLLDSEKMKVWVAEGPCPIQIRDYTEVDLGEIFAGRKGVTANKLPGYRFQTPARTQAKEDYILSFVAAFDGQFELAEKHLERSLANDFVPEAAQVYGVIAWKRGEYKKAKNLFDRGKTHIEQRVKEKNLTSPPPEYFELALFLARSFDLLGDRSEAMKRYKEVANDSRCNDNHLREIAQRGKPYSAKEIEKILMPYSSYIPFT